MIAARRALFKVRVPVRTFIAPTIVYRKEIVQDLFISELRSYKPVLQSTEVDKGAVKELKLPAQPAVPAVSSNIDAELAAYDVTEQVEESAVEEDEYEEAVVRH